jgi:hypothetical protein
VKRSALLSAVLTAALAVFLTGCSRNPVAPTTSTPGAPDAGTMSISQVPVDVPPTEGGIGSTRTAMLTASGEGVLTVGRFTLWIRKNSLKQDATITMRVTDPEAMQVHIEITPASANSFASPVILTANMSDVDNVDYSNTTMAYWDGAWEPMTDVSAHPNQQNIVAHLTSLSDCLVTDGTAGKGNKMQ